MTAVMNQQKELAAVQNAESITQNESQQNSETSRSCKRKRESRTLKFNGTLGVISTALAGVEFFTGLLKEIMPGWGYILLLGVLAANNAANWWLRLDTDQPVK